jgi:UDP-N-acetylmuramoyl-tripeptide--D-alanyl-D-alanine ligase
MMLTLADLIESEQGIRPSQTTPGITEAVVDSRQAIPGSLFIAYQGEKVDGHAFVSDAFNHGASIALVENPIDPSIPVLDLTKPFTSDTAIPTLPFAVRVKNSQDALVKLASFWRRKFNPRVIGITGSVGKSTTKELVAEILSSRFRTLKNQGNLNNEIGLPLTMLRLGPGYQKVILEMGFYYPGEIAQLCEIALPQVGIVTNIGTVHAERAGTRETIARGKSELVQALPPAPSGTAILNLDDPLVAAMQKMTRANVFFYGLNSSAELWADHIESDGLKGLHFHLHYHGETFVTHAPLIGQHSVHTILRAIAAALIEEMPIEEAINALQHASGQLRLVAARTSEGALLLDDTYNASPESTLAALNLLAELPGRKIAVLGGMFELGEYEREGHEKVGVRAAQVADQLITLGDLAKTIAFYANEAGMDKQFISSYDEPDQVVEMLRSTLAKGDVVLVKGSHGLRMDHIVQALEVEE